MSRSNSDPSTLSQALSPSNAAYLEALYQQYRNDSDAVTGDTREIFDSLDQDLATVPSAASPGSAHSSRQVADQKQGGVQQLIDAFRHRGHLIARLDPLGLTATMDIRELTLQYNGLTKADLEREFFAGGIAGKERLKLAQIYQILKDAYSSSVGVEYTHITDINELNWLQARLEQSPARPLLDDEERRRILERLTAAEGLERYLHTKYVGQKRFSLEGAESLIPMLNDTIQRCGLIGTKEIVIGMAHRGRLNVLINTLGKSPADMFGEFEGRYSGNGNELDSGDVKYHQGFSSDILTPGGPVHLALAFNPSHLEIIDPVVEGSVRARQNRRKDTEKKSVVPLLVHGDAAFAGQGVVMETFNMSEARGFSNGGTVHIIVNNQIGFTTSNPLDARSTYYCTEVAKLVQAPIFHVNSDDPDAVIFVSRLALDYRMKFGKDVVVDLVCYRRHGHNEADEPAVTQPLMYQTIRNHPTTRQIYADKLISDGVIDEQQATRYTEQYRDALDDGRVVAGQIIDPNKAAVMVDWTPYLTATWTMPAVTSITGEKLAELSEILQTLPEGFELHPRVRKIMSDRREMAAGDKPMDWGFAENMAYASLIDQEYSVRLTGQDCGRGTFFHRHAVLHNQVDKDVHVPLSRIGDDPDRMTIINSLLSEEAVLGFEYGYSTTDPTTLVIWEAQFGDFANGAQVVIDQFISSGEAKWGRLSGLTLLLPHGYEGQGPEHSSARLERYLQLCAEHNMQVCVPSTPAQMFHMLRRQAIRPYRRPLVVMSPKSLLRHKLSVSEIADITSGGFKNVIGETRSLDAKSVRRVVLASGKVYFDLVQERDQREIEDVAIVRVEQLHPFPKDDLTREIFQYRNAAEVVWCQEEPQNQGAWYQTRHHLKECMLSNQKLIYAGRAAAASPAVGNYALHLEQQQALVNHALTVDSEILSFSNVERG